MKKETLKPQQVQVQIQEDEYICPQCDKPDNGTPMIGCDKCDQWYHWQCVGINIPPKDEDSWFCPQCIEKQAAIAYKMAKVRRQ